MDDVLGEVLECSVCFHQLDTTAKVLPCQHTFCYGCLNDISRSHKELRCPECRALVEVPIDTLPNNILLIRILEGFKKKPSTSSEADISKPVTNNEFQKTPVPVTTDFSYILNLYNTPSTSSCISNAPCGLNGLDSSHTVPSVQSSAVTSSLISSEVLAPISVSKENMTTSANDHSRSFITLPSNFPSSQALNCSSNCVSNNFLTSTSQSNGDSSSLTAVSSNLQHSTITRTSSNNPFLEQQSSFRFLSQSSSLTSSPVPFHHSISASDASQISSLSSNFSSSGEFQPAISHASSIPHIPISSLPTTVQTMRQFSSPLSTVGNSFSLSGGSLLSSTNPANARSEPLFSSLQRPSSVSSMCGIPRSPLTALLNASQPSQNLSVSTPSNSAQTLSKNLSIENVTPLCQSPSVSVQSGTFSSVSITQTTTSIAGANAVPLPSTATSQVSTLFSVEALFSYNSSKPRDLNFTKGSIIQIQRVIDSNWYYGEYGGRTGFLPSAYVKTVPNRTSSLQEESRGVALYDFKIEQQQHLGTRNRSTADCLTFNKGDMIKVLRRVDQNWAEGSIGDTLGIFPLNFVRLNFTASALLNISSQSSSDSLNTSACLERQNSLPSITTSSSPILQSSSISNSISSSSPEPTPLTIPANTGLPSSCKGSNNNMAMLYVARFGYVPQKADEVELTKGCLYAVTQRCQDGWYKGRCLTTHKVGVFPGNYLYPARGQTIADYLTRRPTNGGANRLSEPPGQVAAMDVGPPPVGPRLVAPPRSDDVKPALPPQRDAPTAAPLLRDRYRCVEAYPASSPRELALEVGDVVYVLQNKPPHMGEGGKGWLFGQLQRTAQQGVFPATFVEPL